jgi:hypothetical protein
MLTKPGIANCKLQIANCPEALAAAEKWALLGNCQLEICILQLEMFSADRFAPQGPLFPGAVLEKA